jgi:hypothetical protein
MTEPRRRWFVDIWDPDDPAVARTRATLRSQPVTDAPGPAEPPKVAPDTAPEPKRAAEDSRARHGRIVELVRRIRPSPADSAIVQELKELLG